MQQSQRRATRPFHMWPHPAYARSHKLTSGRIVVPLRSTDVYSNEDTSNHLFKIERSRLLKDSVQGYCGSTFDAGCCNALCFPHKVARLIFDQILLFEESCGSQHHCPRSISAFGVQPKRRHEAFHVVERYSNSNHFPALRFLFRYHLYPRSCFFFLLDDLYPMGFYSILVCSQSVRIWVEFLDLI